MAAGEIQFLARQTRKATLALDHEEPHVVLAQKPSWFKSPLASGDGEPSSAAPHPHPHLHYTQSFDSVKNNEENAIPDENGCYEGYPPFKRYEEPTLLEILYDLFFAANYNVFAQNQSVTNHQRFKAYVGYFSLLWGTWFVVTLYDVRYVTDSIFERMARAIQLGVLVGFAVVAPNFDPEDQSRSTMMTMSLILCASRVCLAIEYAHTLAQVYKYKRARRPLYAQIAINVISAAVYLGITFRFEKRNSRVYITWYIFTAGEAVLTLLLSNFWKTLSFTRTHLMKRLSLITVMILGEGIQSVAQNIATIVKTPAAWNSYTIGVITSATGTIYFVFLVYFDWMRQLQLPPWRQQIWTSLHYPFHLALVLFMQGFTQLILWGKAFNVFSQLTSGWTPGLRAPQTAELFELYPPKYEEAWTAVNTSIANITTIPDNLWTTLQQYVATNNDNVFTDDTLDSFVTFVEQVNVIISSMANSVFNTFDIDLSTELQQKHPNDSSIIKSAEYQVTISGKTQKRSRLVVCTFTLLHGVSSSSS
ncbi:hypothetical protein NQ176_g3667 [Zarea fungicola]|uniref:Uncharacterized protein n=1 Tax=Zarea fungicola TaxID=93591 RepID=A0ACC1NIG9_9HYPO|nr:hypothetical protein NQ176_g3667 [Lecanicillium fungicola]